jgi:hypothetical protein
MVCILLFYTRSNKASDTAPLIKIIYDIKSVANIGCLCNATFAKLQKASVHDFIFSIFFTFKFLFSWFIYQSKFKGRNMGASEHKSCLVVTSKFVCTQWTKNVVPVTGPQEHVALLQVLPLFVPLLFGDCHVAPDPVCSAVDNAADIFASLHERQR